MAKTSGRAAERDVAKTSTARDTIGREKVESVALELFLQRGYSGTSMKALATELGISAPALYWYFPSKEDLYVAVMEGAMTDFLSHVRRARTDSDPLVQLGQTVRAHVTWQLQRSDAARVFDVAMSLRGNAQVIPSERLDPLVELGDQYVREIRELLKAGNAHGLMTVNDIKTTAFAVVTLCEYVHTWFSPAGPLSVEAVANRYEEYVRRLVGA